MSRREKINIVLDEKARLVHVIKCATDDQLNHLVEEVQKELERELDEAAFVWFFKWIVQKNYSYWYMGE